MYVTEHVTVLCYILVSLVRGPLPQLLPAHPAPTGPQGPREPLVVEETKSSNEEENQNTRDYFPESWIWTILKAKYTQHCSHIKLQTK